MRQPRPTPAATLAIVTDAAAIQPSSLMNKFSSGVMCSSLADCASSEASFLPIALAPSACSEITTPRSDFMSEFLIATPVKHICDNQQRCPQSSAINPCAFLMEAMTRPIYTYPSDSVKYSCGQYGYALLAKSIGEAVTCRNYFTGGASGTDDEAGGATSAGSSPSSSYFVRGGSPS